MYSVCTAAIRCVLGENITARAVEERIGNVLRGAKDRAGGRKRRLLHTLNNVQVPPKKTHLFSMDDSDIHDDCNFFNCANK